MATRLDEDCIYWPTGCGQPVFKPERVRHYATDFYYHSYCPYCRDYSAVPKPESPPPVFRPRPVDKEIDQLKAQVLYFSNKVGELQARRKPKGLY